jgi:hypothetical protein
MAFREMVTMKSLFKITLYYLVDFTILFTNLVNPNLFVLKIMGLHLTHGFFLSLSYFKIIIFKQ